MKTYLWAVVALAGMASAHASDLSYSYAEGGFGRMEIDGIDPDGEGFFIGGSMGFGTNWLAYVEYGSADFEEGGVEATIDELQLGFGGHFPMSERVDFVGKLAYLDQSIEVDVPGLGSVSDDENGFMLSAGVRGRALEKLDLMAALEYVDVGEEDDTGLALRGVYDFTDMFSLGGRIDYADDSSQYGIFARFRF